MEISLLNEKSVRIKGKQGSVIINPVGKAFDANGFIILGNEFIDPAKLNDDFFVIKGPGEYEFGGIKVSGVRNGTDVVFSLRVDRIEILLGRASVLEKEFTKLKEHNIVLLYNTETIDPSFVTSLATNVIIFYGEKAEETMNNLAKEGFRKESKYSASFDKLPLEIEKVLLS